MKQKQFDQLNTLMHLIVMHAREVTQIAARLPDEDRGPLLEGSGQLLQGSKTILDYLKKIQNDHS